MDVGVLTCGLGFVFGSPSRLGWRPHFDGDSVVSANMGYVRGSLQGREREWRMVAGWDIIGGAIGHSLKVVAAHGCLAKEVPMAPWPFVVVGTCGHSLMVVMGPSCRSSIVVVGGHGRSLILVMGTCRWW